MKTTKMKYPIGTVLQHSIESYTLIVSQRYDDQVVLQRDGMDFCRASVSEVERFTFHARRQSRAK